MQNYARQRERLAEMHTTIVMLRVELVQREREAGELLDGEDAATDASNRVAATRMLLDAERDKHIALSQEILARMCPAHGDARQVTCPECAELSPELRAYHDTYVKAVRELEAEGRAA